jgi:hypothetical protein
MKRERFTKIVVHRLNECQDVLTMKAAEYAPAKDRLANFKKAAVLQGSGPEQALGGMLAKHVVAIYDFLLTPSLIKQEQWLEKIGDSINYLLLLEAVLQEEYWDKEIN